MADRRAVGKVHKVDMSQHITDFLCSLIEYRYAADAKRAIGTLNNALFFGRPVHIREVRGKSNNLKIYKTAD